MDELTRQVLAEIRDGEFAFKPDDGSHGSLMEFQNIAKRIHWAKEHGYIKDISTVSCTYVGQPEMTVLSIRILGGLTLEGERALREPPDTPI